MLQNELENIAACLDFLILDLSNTLEQPDSRSLSTASRDLQSPLSHLRGSLDAESLLRYHVRIALGSFLVERCFHARLRQMTAGRRNGWMNELETALTEKNKGCLGGLQRFKDLAQRVKQDSTLSCSCQARFDL